MLLHCSLNLQPRFVRACTSSARTKTNGSSASDETHFHVRDIRRNGFQLHEPGTCSPVYELDCFLCRSQCPNVYFCCWPDLTSFLQVRNMDHQISSQSSPLSMRSF